MIYQWGLCQSLMTVQGERVREKNSDEWNIKILEVCTAGLQFFFFKSHNHEMCRVPSPYRAVLSFSLKLASSCPCSLLTLHVCLELFLRFNTTDNHTKGVMREVRMNRTLAMQSPTCFFSLFDLDGLCRLSLFWFPFHSVFLFAGD